MSLIALATGGTGGHLLPAQRVAYELLERGQEVFLVGGNLHRNPYVEEGNLRIESLSAAPLNLSPHRIIQQSGRILLGFLQALRLFKKARPDLLVGFGGYASFPPLLSAQLMGIPYLLVEPNAYPGRITRLFARRALEICGQYFEAAHHLPRPITPISLPLSVASFSKGESRKRLGLDPDLPTFLIMGGSQGADILNDTFAQLIREGGLPHPLQILQTAGSERKAAELRTLYQQAGVSSHVTGYSNQMELFWKAADFALLRSGASTVAESLFFGVPALFVPFARAADDHQRANALPLVEAGGAGLLLEERCKPEALRGELFQEGVWEKRREVVQEIAKNWSLRPTLADRIIQFAS